MSTDAMETVAPETPRGIKITPVPPHTGNETKEPPLPLSEEPDRPVFVAVDTEGLGTDMVKYPTVAVAFAVVDATGKKLYTSENYMPYAVNEHTIEPRCYQEFWNNPEKCDPAVFQALQKNCKESRFKSPEEFWQNISKTIDEIYEIFGPKNVTWVGDCLDYDYGRIDYELMSRSIRPMGLRYDTETKQRHCVEDCDSGLEVLRQVNPDKYSTYKQWVAEAKLSHSHNCLDDALCIATKYVLFKKAVQAYVDELMN